MLARTGGKACSPARITHGTLSLHPAPSPSSSPVIPGHNRSVQEPAILFALSLDAQKVLPGQGWKSNTFLALPCSTQHGCLGESACQASGDRADGIAVTPTAQQQQGKAGESEDVEIFLAVTWVNVGRKAGLWRKPPPPQPW